MVNIISHQENANSNYNEIPLDTSRMDKIKKMITSVGEDVEKLRVFLHCWLACEMVQPL